MPIPQADQDEENYRHAIYSILVRHMDKGTITKVLNDIMQEIVSDESKYSDEKVSCIPFGMVVDMVRDYHLES